MPAPRGWSETAGDNDMAALSGSNLAKGTGAGEARRAAEQMFACRKPVRARILPTITKTAMSLEEAAVEPAVEPVAAASSEPFLAEVLDAAPVPPQPDGAAAETTAVPSAGRRATRRPERPVLPPGQRRLWSLPESCWPEAVRRAARRNRRRALREAAGDGEPVQ